LPQGVNKKMSSFSSFIHSLPPFFEKILSPPESPSSTSTSVLLLGAGGGYDIFGALYLYDLLKKSNQTVHLANYSFTDRLDEVKNTTSITPYIYKINPDSEATHPAHDYFPELWLAKTLNIPIYTTRLLHQHTWLRD
jgi:hypothetical protein